MPPLTRILAPLDNDMPYRLNSPKRVTELCNELSLELGPGMTDKEWEQAIRALAVESRQNAQRATTSPGSAPACPSPPHGCNSAPGDGPTGSSRG